jgi:hypothetical protein
MRARHDRQRLPPDRIPDMLERHRAVADLA